MRLTETNQSEILLFFYRKSYIKTFDCLLSRIRIIPDFIKYVTVDDNSESVFPQKIFFPISTGLKNSSRQKRIRQQILVSFTKIFITFTVY